MTIRKRRAKDENGKSYLVSADMDYEQWRGSLTEEQNQKMDLNKKIRENETQDKKQHKKYKKVLGKESPSNFEKFQDLKYNDKAGYDELKKIFRAENKKLLTENEKYAINNYISSESYILNEKLRKGLELSNTDRAIIKNLDAALDKLSNYKGTLSRSVDLDNENLAKFIKEHKVGNNIEYKAYTSFTHGDNHNPDANVQLFVECTKGKDMSNYNAAENEVLYKKNSAFAVKEVQYLNEKYYIFLEEL